MSRVVRAAKWLAMWLAIPMCLWHRERWVPSMHRTLYAGRDRA